MKDRGFTEFVVNGLWVTCSGVTWEDALVEERMSYCGRCSGKFAELGSSWTDGKVGKCQAVIIVSCGFDAVAM